MSDLMLRIDNISKQYILGQIGGTTLRDELQRLSARMHHREDPTKLIGQRVYNKGETFMALDGVTFDVVRGERIGIIGHNGAGKSTLLKLISRVTAPTSGTIGLNGRVASMLEVGTGFHPELTGRENIYMNGAILGMTRQEIDSKLEDIIEFSECRQFIDTPVKRYSSGMYVKLAFSVAAHLESEIMIMDEVLAVGDAAFQKKCLQKMSDVSKDEGRTILYVSHNMGTIRELCDRCIVMAHGRISYDGGVEESIAMYSGANAGGLQASINLSDARRPPHGQHGIDLFVTSFAFENKDHAIFLRKEKVSFQVIFAVNARLESLKLYFIIYRSDGTVIGMMQSFIGTGTCEPGRSYRYRGELDFTNIASGDYYFYVDVFSDNGVGGHYSVDHPLEPINFRIIDDETEGLIWQHKYYGNIRLNPIELKEFDVLN